jgi:hypothetical protein
MRAAIDAGHIQRRFAWGQEPCARGRFVDEAEYAHAVDEDDRPAEPAAEGEQAEAD